MSTPNIEIQTEADNIINTLPELHVPFDSNIQIETSTRDDDIKSNLDTDRDRDGHHHDTENENDFEFLVNKNKVYSPKEKKKDLDLGSERGREGTERHSEYGDNRSDHHKSPLMEPLHPIPDPLPTPPFQPSGMGSGGGGPDMGSFFNNSGIFESIKTQTMSEDDIRKEKSYLLHQFENKNVNHRYSPKILDMNNSLDEIKNELEYINSKRDMENNMDTWKQGMFLFLNGVVQLNNSYDPFDVDLSDWLKDVHYDLMRKGKFDEVLEELIIKWRGKIPMSAEMRLVGLLGMSLAGNVMSKRQEKRDKLKREQEERLMEEKIQRNVQAQMERMMQQQQQQQQQQQEFFQQQQRQFYQQQQAQAPPQAAPQVPSIPPSVSPVKAPETQKESEIKLSGPSLSDEDILKLVQQDFADSVAEDEVSISSVLENKKDSKKKEPKEKKPRGRPKKNQLVITPVVASSE